MTTSAARDENRLTDADRQAIRSAMAEAIAERPRYCYNLGALVTRGLREGIRCNWADLRQSEISEAKAIGREVIAEADAQANGVTCPRCDREAVGWPLERADRCSPRDWVYCIRRPELILAGAERKG